MRSCSPQDAGHSRDKPLEALGGVQRFSCAEGELWWLGAEHDWPRGVSHRQLAEQLWRRAQAGWFGFVDAGVTEEGAWLLRRLPEDNLSAWLKREPGPWPWRRAVSLALRLAGALQEAEESGLFAGMVTPSRVWLAAGDGEEENGQAWLRGESLLRALVGAPGGGRGTGTRASELLWAPPELADVERWGHAHNRYALGAVLYRLLAGKHPFGGAGLRHALREAARSDPAPFPVEVRRALPAGLQSLCLRLLARAPEERPAHSSDIAAELSAVLRGERLSDVAESSRRGARPSRASSPGRRSRTSSPERKSRQSTSQSSQPVAASAWRLAPLLAGTVLLVGALAWWQSAEPAPEVKPTKASVGDARALDSSHTRAQDCASCHPRHTAEWSQSVMGHSVKSPLFNALEALIEEQVGRDFDCPGGAGVLRRAEPGTACRDRQSGLSITGSGGEHWCVNCHSPGDNLASVMPAWQGRGSGDPRTRLPVRDLISPLAMEGISCAFCHQVHGPVGARSNDGVYQGNPSWVSFVTGSLFLSRPEDRRGLFGIANSGYRLDPSELLLIGGRNESRRLARLGGSAMPVHARPTDEARRYLQSSEFCGACHDVRLFGTDVIGAQIGEHFKRLRNAYSEWDAWAQRERAAGKRPASCQDCHMSTYPGVCVRGKKRPGNLDDEACPKGMRFEAHEPGRRVAGSVAVSSTKPGALTPHYFTGVDLPLARELSEEALDQSGVDQHGLPLSTKKRRDLLLRRSMHMELGEARRASGQLTIPIEIENTGAGHRIPAGFSQEREIWVHLRIEDANGRLAYEVGRVDRNDQDLGDKIFLRVNTDPNRIDGQGRPVGLFGADIANGPDHPEWSPPPELGGRNFRGKGLINFQNGFLRCVRCIGTVTADGRCEPRFGERHRAERFTDGDYDIDTGECRSNLSGRQALFETFFPVGALDADRGFVKGPDAIIDTRSLAPGEPVLYTYELPVAGLAPPFKVTARLMFRSFPPFLVRAFAEYEQHQARAGKRPSGPLVSFDMLARLERIELARQTLTIP